MLLKRNKKFWIGLDRKHSLCYAVIVKEFEMKYLLIAAITAVTVGLTSIPAYADHSANEPVCDNRNVVLDKLSSPLDRGGYAESLIAAGLSNSGNLIELITNDTTGTFTIIVTKPNKESCLVAAGEGFHFLSEEEKEKLKILTTPAY